jgi:hypothetical protein
MHDQVGPKAYASRRGQINKLPKWAQTRMASLVKRCQNAESKLNEYLDTKTESPFFVDEMLCQGTLKVIKRYIPGIYTIAAVKDGVRVDVTLLQDRPGILVQWTDDRRSGSDIAMIPTSFQQVRIVAKDKMRS